MLAGFQISHSDELKGSSHNHRIFYVQSTNAESMLLSLLIYMRPHLPYMVTRALYQKEHCLTYRSDVIFEV